MIPTASKCLLRKPRSRRKGEALDAQQAWPGTAWRPLPPHGRSPSLGLALGRHPLCHLGPGHGLSGRCHLPLPGKPGRARRRQPLPAVPSRSHPADLLLAHAWGKVGDQGRRLPLCQLWGPSTPASAGETAQGPEGLQGDLASHAPGPCRSSSFQFILKPWYWGPLGRCADSACPGGPCPPPTWAGSSDKSVGSTADQGARTPAQALGLSPLGS